MEDYWCLCVLKNSYTTEKSKRAYIKIACKFHSNFGLFKFTNQYFNWIKILDLDSKFQKPYPQSGGVEFGVEFLLDCKPPRGVPEPISKSFIQVFSLNQTLGLIKVFGSNLKAI